MRVIEGPYLRDLLAQPEAIRATAEALARGEAEASVATLLEAARPPRIVLTGMGASLHALHPLLLELLSRGVEARIEETSELLYYRRSLLAPRTLVVAVSQSGESAELVRLAKLRRNGWRMLAVTNCAESTLAAKADAAVTLAAGAEHSVSCKTYVATLAALAWLGGILTGRRNAARRALREMLDAAGSMAAYLSHWRRHTATLARQVEGVRYLALAGRGPSLAAALTGGLIVKEAAHFPAEGMSAAAFRHGPLEMCGPGAAVVVFEGADKTAELNRGLARDVRRAGGKAVLVGPGGRGAGKLPPASPRALPLLEILPVQMTTLALAALAGREAGRFERAAKVTRTE